MIAAHLRASGIPLRGYWSGSSEEKPVRASRMGRYDSVQMRQTPSDLSLRKLVVELFVTVAIGVALALLRPFGSTGVPFATGLIYWLSMTLGGYLLFRPIMFGATRIADRLEFPLPIVFAAATLVASVPLTILVHFASKWAFGSAAENFSQAVALYGNVLVIAAGVTSIFWLLGRPHAAQIVATVVSDRPHSSPEHPRFIDRLPPHLGIELIALEMEDHYVRAHTANGSVLILLRMRDAVAELATIPGAQVHRSWWVARAAAVGAEQQGRNLRLRLTNGLIVPIARNSVASLATAGWPVQPVA